jgi:hypothetical protein
VDPNSSGQKVTDKESCLQVLECIRWPSLPLKESILAARWPELGLGVDPEFLVRQAGREEELPHNHFPLDLLRSNYSVNR